MRLRYLKKDGEERDVELSDKPVTIGRSADADVLVLDEKASRVHCGIRYADGAFFIRDLKSKNGTFVNDKAVDLHQLRPGDRIRVGSTVFLFEQPIAAAADSALQEVQGKIADGAGYSTILREIVHEAAPSKAARPEAPPEAPEPASEAAPEPTREPAPPQTQAALVEEPEPAEPESPAPGGKRLVVRKKSIRIKKMKKDDAESE